MKKKIAAIGFVGVVSLLFGCSDDAPSPAAPPIAYNESSSSVVTGASSSSFQQQTPTSSAVNNGGKTIYEHKIIDVPAENVDYPNIVEEKMFCWTPGCEATVVPPSSSSKAAPKSSSQNAITIDTPENKPPIVNGMTMTDARDNKTYQLMQIGGKLWMAQDINYAGVTSECFNEQESNCTSNGRLYTFNSAQKACPTGWRLPNREEAQAALDDATVPWSYSGRCKDGDCNFMGQMGFHWTSATPQDGDKNFEDNKGDSYTVIIVEKDPDYAGEKERLFFQVDSKTKRFSVRCVQE
ncbi:FISUMP domain-containing protein [Fibrobacter sp. UWB12]|uniref:FISUMP domain-containing protein n=1 Tax=Fibrobacter sp. UWB12 TaxID=1896203 RepID=UPI0009244720|nr:FISUMP domain-containing protein [Fibrobacter sp. UWB12]SHL01867.1 major paralogous domain-containing protein [Fibrobacter sp. UWB12]